MIQASAQSSLPLHFFLSAELVKVFGSGVPRVIDMLKDRDLWVRTRALTALGEFSQQRE